MKEYIKLCFVLFFIFDLTVFAQTGIKKGVAVGNVINASLDSIAIADQKVMLYQYVDGKENQGEKPFTFTDINGRFIFKGIEISEHFTYYPLAAYKGVEYKGKLIKPTQDVSQQVSDIYVFEPTSSDSAISIVSYHIFIERGISDLIIREIYIFVNRDNYTYVGNTETTTGVKKVLQMEIPPNAKELQFGGNLMECCAVVEGSQIYDTMDLKPGTRQVELRYLLPYKKNEVNFVKPIVYRAEALDIFVSEPSQIDKFSVHRKSEISEPAVENQPLESKPFQTRSKKYNLYRTKNISRGSIIEFTISNLPVPQRDYRWLAPVILISIITAGFLLNRRKKVKTV